MNTEKIIKYSAIVVIIAVVLVSALNFVSGYITFGGKVSSDTEGYNTYNTALSDGSVQKVKLTMQGYTYNLEPSTLKMNVPVEMEVDMSTVTGCMRDVVIKDFNVRQYVSEGKNIIKFTPTKEGTFGIACSMNMGRGVFSVTNEGKITPASTAELETQKAQILNSPTGGTCGGSGGGGCGCGMMR
jgi:plastocyanin domain-containing protein